MFAKLLLLFVTVPILEFLLLVKIGSEIGVAVTFAIILITGFLGALLTRVQGLRTLRRFQQATAEGRLPHEEVLDGVMILVAGAVLLTPGFLTDVFGFLLLIPPVRALLRKLVASQLKSRIHIASSGMGVHMGGGRRVFGQDAKPAPSGRRDASGGDARVIEAEIVDD